MTGIELTVGGWFASSIIRKVIDAARSYLGNNYDLQTGTTDMVTSLELSLSRIQAAIEVATKMPTKNSGLATWLENLKNVASEAEDVLDDLEAKRIQETLKGKNKVIEFASSSGKIIKTLIFSDKELKVFKSVVEKLSKISMGVVDFIELMQHDNGINGKIEHTGTNRRETSSNLDPNSKIFGRNKEINSILNIISNSQLMCFPEGNLDHKPESQPTPLDDGKGQEVRNIKSSVSEQNSVCIRDWKLPVLPIVGLGGVGKTTIAKMIYNNKRVKESFSLRTWIYVSENFDVKRIMKEIVLSFEGGSHIDIMMNLDTIARELIKTIQIRRFFLVLDDVHDGIESIWSCLLSVLGNGVIGSFILVTTQSERVAKTIGNMSNIVTLDVLEADCFEQLFQYYAFGAFKLPHMGKMPPLINMEEDELNTMKLIANKIAGKLHGLPLAGEVIGKMLHTQLQIVHWENILKSDWWDHDRALEGILPSLGIGYTYLDPELKLCFAFCSIFPKHYVFDRNRLVQMWMAHGFIQPNEKEKCKLDVGQIRLEDVGNKRFDELVDRSFFQATISDGKYIMHEPIRDLAIAISLNEFSYVKSHDKHLPSCTRHLAIDCDGSKFEGESQNNTGLRTLMLFGNWNNCSDESISNMFAKSKALRLLNLSYIGIETTTPVDAICQLSHLRFVDLSFSGINMIPEKFCELRHLELLDVRGCKFKKLPKGMNKLTNLRHLYANTKTISLISGIGKLINLQELKKFYVRKIKGYKISELRDMNEISGHLILNDLQNVSSKEEAATSQLAKKSYLKNLELEFRYPQLINRWELEVLEALKPSPSVEMLTIRGGRGDLLPDWMWSTRNGFSNLKCIKVSDFSLTTLPAFGEIPFLEILSFDHLNLIQMVGDEFYGNSDVAFPSLKELTFSSMSCWRVWLAARAGKKSYPHLKRIHLEYCEELMDIPINFSTSPIVELKLLRCPSIHNIATMLQGMPSLTHLSITEYINDLSICCTTLKFLQVMYLSVVKRLCFVGGLKSLVNLRKLVVKGIGEFLESIEVEQENGEISEENEEQCLQFLNYLHLGHRYDSTRNLFVVVKMPSLRTLFIGWSPAIDYTREEESWFGQLTSLEELMFYNCRNLKRLPLTLPMLSSLMKLTIVSCPSISSLPGIDLPQSLVELCISGCPELTHLCQPNQGDDWLNPLNIMAKIDDYDLRH